MNKLNKYLTINSVFSATSGLSMLVFSDGLNGFFNISNKYVFPVIGFNLVVFSIFVLYVSRKQLTNKLLVNLISGLDAVWVLGSLAIVAFGLFDLSGNGNIMVGVVGVWIAFLGFKQFQNNK